jgi:hypothetical protein
VPILPATGFAVSADELHGYVVEVQKGTEHLDVSLVASSEKAAIARTRMSMVHGRRDLAWMNAGYQVVETVSLEEFKAGREAGTR